MTADEQKRRQDRERKRALRASRRAAGVCADCGGALPAAGGGFRCPACLVKAARQVAGWRRCHRERGRCPRCGEQYFDRRWKQCGECRAKVAARERARLARLREGAAALAKREMENDGQAGRQAAVRAG